jgi:hypothetical protein
MPVGMAFASSPSNESSLSPKWALRTDVGSGFWPEAHWLAMPRTALVALKHLVDLLAAQNGYGL